jgi:hypothetical protein
MRSIQRGITTTFIIVIILVGAVSIASVYFTYTLNKKPSVNSFEDCAKLYPVMESYPEQCNTPDGKHFTKELSDIEKEKLRPVNLTEPTIVGQNIPNSPSLWNSVNEDEFVNWKTYKNEMNKFSLEYPSDLLESGNAEQIFLVKSNATAAEKLSYADQLIEIRIGNNISRFNQYYDTLNNQEVEGFGDVKIRNKLIGNYQTVEYGYNEADEEKQSQLNKEAIQSGKSVGAVNFRKGLMINKQGTVIEISTNYYTGEFKQVFDQVLTTLKFLQ